MDANDSMMKSLYQNLSGTEIIIFEKGNKFTLVSTWSANYASGNVEMKGTYLRATTGLTLTVTYSSSDDYTLSYISKGGINLLTIKDGNTLQAPGGAMKKIK